MVFLLRPIPLPRKREDKLGLRKTISKFGGGVPKGMNGKQKSAYGYVWRYVDSAPYIPLDELVEILEDEVDRLNNLVLKMKGID